MNLAKQNSVISSQMNTMKNLLTEERSKVTLLQIEIDRVTVAANELRNVMSASPSQDINNNKNNTFNSPTAAEKGALKNTDAMTKSLGDWVVEGVCDVFTKFDKDNDGVLNENDGCPSGTKDWVSSNATCGTESFDETTCNDKWRKEPCDLALNDTMGLVTQGSSVPLQSVDPPLSDEHSTFPSVDGVSDKNSMFMFAYNQCKPECCPSTYSCSGGCVCTTDQQRKFLKGRGNNKSFSDDEF